MEKFLVLFNNLDLRNGCAMNPKPLLEGPHLMTDSSTLHLYIYTKS